MIHSLSTGFLPHFTPVMTDAPAPRPINLHPHTPDGPLLDADQQAVFLRPIHDDLVKLASQLHDESANAYATGDMSFYTVTNHMASRADQAAAALGSTESTETVMSTVVQDSQQLSTLVHHLQDLIHHVDGAATGYTSDATTHQVITADQASAHIAPDVTAILHDIHQLNRTIDETIRLADQHPDYTMLTALRDKLETHLGNVDTAVQDLIGTHNGVSVAMSHQVTQGFDHVVDRANQVAQAFSQAGIAGLGVGLSSSIPSLQQDLAAVFSNRQALDALAHSVDPVIEPLKALEAHSQVLLNHIHATHTLPTHHIDAIHETINRIMTYIENHNNLLANLSAQTGSAVQGLDEAITNFL